MSLRAALTPWFLAALVALPALADEPPGPTASDREKLDYLIASWRGQPEEVLRQVWGRPESLDERGDTKTYRFLRTKRGPMIGLGGIRVAGRGTIECRAYFQTALEGIVTRATWRGPSPDDCWSLFREIMPPSSSASPSSPP